MNETYTQAWKYSVRCTFPSVQIRDQWIEWLMDGHAQALIDAGALSATLTQYETDSPCVEVQYLFADRQAFGCYERDHAPRLREQGLQRWPAEVGLQYERNEGAVIALLSTRIQRGA